MYCGKCGSYLQNNENFCGKCGSPNHVVAKINSNVKPNNNVHICVIVILGVLICLVFGMSLGAFAKNMRNNEIYIIDEEPEVAEKNEKTKKEDAVKENNNASSGNENKTKSNNTTEIKYDNFYSGQNIRTEEEARELIVKDSLEQKSNDYEKELLEIENRIIKNYNITAVNMEGIDIELAREIEEVVRYIYNKYPTARKYLTNLTLINASIRDSYIAVFMGISPFADTLDDTMVNKTIIGLNSRFFLNLSKLKNSTSESAKAGHFPKNANGASTVAHEFGHYLSFLASMKSNGMESVLLVDNGDYTNLYNLMNDWNKGENSLKIIEEAYENYKKKYNENISLLEFRSSISQYAVTKDNDGNYIYDETISEAFHDYYLNGENAAKASKEVVAVLEKEIQNL